MARREASNGKAVSLYAIAPLSGASKPLAARLKKNRVKLASQQQATAFQNGGKLDHSRFKLEFFDQLRRHFLGRAGQKFGFLRLCRHVNFFDALCRLACDA